MFELPSKVLKFIRRLLNEQAWLSRSHQAFFPNSQVSISSTWTFQENEFWRLLGYSNPLRYIQVSTFFNKAWFVSRTEMFETFWSLPLWFIPKTTGEYNLGLSFCRIPGLPRFQNGTLWGTPSPSYRQTKSFLQVNQVLLTGKISLSYRQTKSFLQANQVLFTGTKSFLQANQVILTGKLSPSYRQTKSFLQAN